MESFDCQIELNEAKTILYRDENINFYSRRRDLLEEMKLLNIYAEQLGKILQKKNISDLSYYCFVFESNSIFNFNLIKVVIRE